MDEGVYNITWHGTDDNGAALPSGVYFYEMKTAEYQSVKKLLLVK